MPGPFTDLDETIFVDKGVLAEDYQPSDILERDDEITDFRDALKDILFGRNPQNIFIYGKAGLGKTAVTKYMMNHLLTETDSRTDADDLHVHHQNCNGKTAFLVVRNLVNSFRDSHEEFPKRGLGLGDAFNELYDELDATAGTHLFVFDEIDHLSDVDTLLYELPRARANDHLDNARVGVIGISNNYQFRNTLSPKVKDTLMETEISFSPYDAGELRTILEDRADAALVEDGYSEGAITKAAALAARDRGSARQAIDFLRVGAEIAESNGVLTVEDAHIEAAKDRVQRGRLANKIRDQTIHAQLVLEALAYLSQQDSTPARAKVVYEVYCEVADSWAHDPLTTVRSIQSHLSDLEMLGFVTQYERNEGRSGGQYYEFDLDLEPDPVLETREEIKASS